MEISEFYQGKEILLIGATTFPGKVLLEKLLWSCPDVEKIYCPVRRSSSTANHSAEDTFAEIYTSKLFDRVRRVQAKFHEKIVPFELECLFSTGKDEFVEKIQESVEICFYVADTSVDFKEENLRDLIERNVIDLKKILNVLKSGEKLRSLVYLSSIFAHFDCPFIEEMIYPSSIDPMKFIDALSWMDKEMIELATPQLIGPKPNAFAFSHWLAETIINNEKEHFPSVSIVRSSIIGAAWKEPYPGWVERSNGPSELFVAAGRGYLRSMKRGSNDILDIVPVDIPVNLLIVAACQESSTSDGLHIYHCTSSDLNPFHWHEMSNYFTEYSKRIPYEHAFRRPNLSVTSHSFIHDSYSFVAHLIPAYLADVGLRLLGRKPRIVNLYKNLHRHLHTLETLTTRANISCSSNSLNALRQSINETSCANEFNFDIRTLHWPTYIESYLLGTKRYILNEDIHCLEGAQKHLLYLRNIRWTFNTVLLILLWRIFISKRPTARNLWYFIMNFFVAKFVRFFKISSAGSS